MRYLTKKGRIQLMEFFLLSFFSFVFFLIRVILAHGENLYSLIFMGGNDRFMDFFNHIAYCNADGLQNVYYQTYDASFPPLAYLFYGFLGRLIPADQVTMFSANSTGALAILLYVFYCVVLSAGFAAGMNRVIKDKKYTILVFLSVIISYIFCFSVLERGNSVWIVCILLLFAVDLRQSNHPVKKEIALILIAVAAGLKGYPAVFGLLYVAEKRWKETLRLLLYGIAFFFIPFLFCGGIAGMQQFFQNQTKLHSISDSTGNILYFANIIQEKLKTGVSLYPVLTAVIGIISLAGFFLAKEGWIRCLILCGIMILVPKWSGNYTYIYLAVPLCLFMKEKRKTVFDCIAAFLFAGIFSALSYIPIGHVAIYQLCLWILLGFSVCGNIWKHCYYKYHLRIEKMSGEMENAQ